MFKKLLVHIVIAPWSLSKVACGISEASETRRRKLWIYAIPSFILFFLFVLFHILNFAVSGFWAIGWFWYFCFCSYMAAIRFKIREIVGIHGNAIEDFVSSVFMYPSVSMQLEETCKNILFIQPLRDTNTEHTDISSPHVIENVGKTNMGFENE